MSRWAARLPWIAVALFAGLAVAWLWRDPRVRHEAFRDYSIYNSSAKGLSIAYRYLESRGRDVKPLARPVERAFLPADGILLRIAPEPPLDPGMDEETGVIRLRPGHAGDEREASLYAFTAEEEAWVRGGGRLVLALDRRYGSIDVTTAPESAVRKVFPLWPGVAALEPPAPRILAGPTAREGVSLFAAGAAPVVSRIRRGKGDVVLCAAPELFQNGSLGKADHLAFLERLVETERPVYFDEHVHGIERDAGMLEILRQWGFGPFIALIVLAALASFWRRRTRVGPEEDDHRETRVEAVDFVDSLALLYRRMLPRRHALALYAKAFEKAVAVQTGLRDAALQARVRELLPPRESRPAKGKDVAVPDFEKELELINLAFRRLNDAKRPGSGRSTAAGARPA